MKKVLILSLILSVFAVAMFAASATSTVSSNAIKQVVALVNGEPIYAETLKIAANVPETLKAIEKANPKMYQLLVSSKAGTEFLKAYNEAVLSDLIDSVLMEQLAEKNYGIKFTDAQALQKVKEQVEQMLKSYNITKEQFAQYLQSQGYGSVEQFENNSIFTMKFTMTVDALKKAVTSAATVNENEVKQYYNANLDSFKTPKQIDVEHIMVSSEATANAVLKEIKSGNITFESAAAKYSLDKQSKDKNGDLGWIPETSQMPEFEQKLFNTEIGGIVGPVKTSYGWELFKVVGKKDPSIKSLKEVADQIKGQLLSQKQQKLWNDWMKGVFEKFKKESKIKTFI
ncbi:peptidylprolyl isomerase [Mesoaciditoga lauensis]|uniref:peptidylprolyl isomerase n=1 Tax=Mesoaciditoga lauensis TaxID=1495039 RepID=UPI0005645FE9|nr:peptidylprolyl isomerase [Mesoaciditoga lauensis]